MAESETETRAAFITAALVLLVMPLVYVIGLALAMLILQITPWGEMKEVVFGLAIVWGVVVMVGVLIAARRLNRRSARVWLTSRTQDLTLHRGSGRQECSYGFDSETIRCTGTGDSTRTDPRKQSG
jgi:hypothetical protein